MEGSKTLPFFSQCTKSPLKILQIILENFHCLIFNVGTHIVHIHTVLEEFAYPCETGYADFVRFYDTAHLNERFPEPVNVMIIHIIGGKRAGT